MASNHFLTIGIGHTGAMFTLWETEIVRVNNSNRAMRTYHKNLGNTPDTAYDNAVAAMFQMGLPLETSFEDLKEELRKIERDRPTAEILAARQAEMERIQQEQLIERNRLWNEKCHQIDNDLIVFGRHKGTKFADAPVSFVNWLISEKEEFEYNTILRYSAEYCEKTYGIRREFEEGFLGKEKEKISSIVTVVRVYSFNTMYGTKYITTMRTETGHCIVVKSTSFKVKVGDHFVITGTVKELSNYKGNDQTVIQRASRKELA